MNAIKKTMQKLHETISKKQFDEFQSLWLNESFKVSHSQWMLQYQYIIRASLVFLYHRRAEADPQVIAKAFDAFRDLLVLSAKNNEWKLLMENWLLLTRQMDLKTTLKLLNGLAFDTRGWLRSMTDIMQSISTGAGDKQIVFLQLTTLLLTYFDVEMNDLKSGKSSVRKFEETIYFLDVCCKLACFEDPADNDQYIKCFTMFKHFVKGIETVSQLQKLCNELVGEFIENQSMNATLIMDTTVTLGKLFIASQPALNGHLCGDSLLSLFKLLVALNVPIINAKYDKTFCVHCSSNIGFHTSIDIGANVNELMLDAISRGVCSTDLAHCYGTLSGTALKIASLLKCNTTEEVQRYCLIRTRSFISTYSTKEHAKYVLPVLKILLSRHDRFKLSQVKTDTPINLLYILRHMGDALEAAGANLERIRIGMLYLPFAIAEGQENSNNTHRLVYAIAKLQRMDELKCQYFTPFDFLTNPNSNFYKLQLPKDIDHSYILFIYYKLANLYINFPREFNNKIIYQMLTPENVSLSKCLRFVLYSNNFCTNPIETRIRTLFDQLRKMNTSERYPDEIDFLEAIFKFIAYKNSQFALAEKIKPISLGDELSKPTSKELSNVNLKYEQLQRENLLNIKSALAKFAKFYQKLPTTQKKNSDDEIKCLMTNLIPVARNLSFRMYTIEAMETFLLIHRFASYYDDFKIEEIIAVSYFAENHKEYKKVVVKRKIGDELHQLIKACDPKAFQLFKKISELSERKRNEVYWYMMNVSSYYLTENRFAPAIKLLTLVEHHGLPTESNYDAIRVKYEYLQFHLMAQHKISLSNKSMDDIAKEMLSNQMTYRNLVAEETHVVAITFCKAIKEVAQFAMNRRLAIPEIFRAIVSMIKYALMCGCVVRALDMLNLSGHLNVVQENRRFSKENINFISRIYFNDDVDSTPIGSCTKTIDTLTVHSSSVSPIRKVGNMLSPHKMVVNKVEIESVVNRYLVNHGADCKCSLCLNKPITHQMARSAFVALVHEFLQYTDSEPVPAHLENQWKELKDYWLHRCYPIRSEHLFFTVELLTWTSRIEYGRRRRNDKIREHLTSALQYLRALPEFDCIAEQDILAHLQYLKNKNDTTGVRCAKLPFRNLNANIQTAENELSHLEIGEGNNDYFESHLKELENMFSSTAINPSVTKAQFDGAQSRNRRKQVMENASPMVFKSEKPKRSNTSKTPKTKSKLIGESKSLKLPETIRILRSQQK